MDSDEKKFSLDELPDLGSSLHTPEQPAPPKNPPKVVKSADPRRAVLDKVKPEAQIQILQQSWRFDKKEFLFGWIIYAAFFIMLQVLAKSPEFVDEWLRFDEFSLGTVSFMSSIIMNPIIFIILTPFLFKFQTPSATFFDVTFDGISTVAKIYPAKGEFPTRILLKWAEIANVQKTKARERDILLLTTKDAKAVQVIWDIDADKKRGLHQLTKSLIPATHPLRIFLEKDLV